MRCINCMKEFDDQYGVCPSCGFTPGQGPKEPYQLSPGVVLAKRYVIGAALGVGGFGITYKAWDETLQKTIAIKEYYPSANGIVNRVPGASEVIIYSGNREVEFHKGKERFLAEARNTVKFNTHPNIVHVFDFFEENRTAYLVMEYLDGISYKEFIKLNGGRVEEKTAVEVTLSVLDALKEIHKAGIIHRDISPDNVFICQGGMIKLIDFGAARFSTGEEEKTLSIILKPGYAPPEQYQSKSRQGPWTDLYAAGAMLYRAITGTMPPESVNRMVKDELIPPVQLNPSLSENLSNAIMRAMALNQELRFRNVDQFKAAIESKIVVRGVPEELKRRKHIRAVLAGAVSVVLAGAAVFCFMLFQNKRAGVVLQDAQITIWYPVYMENGSIIDDSVDEAEFEDMLDDYRALYPNVTASIEAVPEDEYQERLEEALLAGSDVPAVFDSSCLGADFYDKLEPLDETLAWLVERKELERYYFLDQYEAYFPGQKQMPLSFQLPVIYVNELLVPDAPKVIESVDRLRQLIGGSLRYGVNQKDWETYRRLEASISADYGYSDFVIDLEEEEAAAEAAGGDEYDAEAVRKEALKGKAGIYLSDTSEYTAVQRDMAGIYQVIRLDGMELTGRFTNLWSVNVNADKARKKAGERLIYFLMTKENQQVLNLQNSSGLPLHKEVFEEYEKTNTELDGLADCLEDVSFLNER